MEKLSLDAQVILFGLGSVLTACIVFGIPIMHSEKSSKDISNASVKEGIVLENETISYPDEYSKNTQISIIKKVVVDTNNNGIKDLEDITFKGHKFIYPGPKKGNKVIFLDGKDYKEPLAIVDEDGNFQIINKPSDIIHNKKQAKEIERLNNELNNILTQKSR